MRVIDGHFHIYKDEKAGISAQGGSSLRGFKGTLEEAVAILNRGRIAKLLGVAVIPLQLMRETAMAKWPADATTSQRKELQQELEKMLAARLTRYNDWLCKAAREDGRIIPAIAVEPTVDTSLMLAEISDKIERYQITALKIHPEVAGVFPDHPGYLPVFELAERKGLIVLSHGGVLLSGRDYCAPKSFIPILDRFTKLKLVIAHLAFPLVNGLIEIAARYENVYTDISYITTCEALDEVMMRDTIRKIGAHRVIYGSDFPFGDSEGDLAKLERIGLSGDEMEQLTCRNAERVYRM